MLHRDGDKVRLYTAFLTITASSPYNKNNDYDNFRDIWSLWLFILRIKLLCEIKSIRNRNLFLWFNYYYYFFFFFNSVAL